MYMNSRRNTETKYCILRLLQTDISPTHEFPLNYLPTKENTSKHVGFREEEEGRAHAGWSRDR